MSALQDGQAAWALVVGRWWVLSPVVPGPLPSAQFVRSPFQESALQGASFEQCLCLRRSSPRPGCLRRTGCSPPPRGPSTLFQCFYHGKMHTSVGSPQTTLHWHPLPVSSHLPTGRARFPFSRPELLKEWVLNIGRVNFKPKQHTVICSEHFRPECFSAFGNRKNLKHNAVPTVFAFQNPAQVLPERTEAMEASGLPADPMGLERPFPGQPSDHSYALLDLDTLKKKLFLTLKENKRLRKRLRAQRLLLRRTCSRLRAYREGQRGPRARRPAQQN
ncbi:THAP domain-containing protein 3 isoform X4 [Chionomys nivalis]|uniref:THAP domain-containing protein 3 isoform X4 n=1 Tax=Chionomys nivalis TaxID=269649 RepID=UPI002594C596|nr:THAP domain-containing protein 3 isoform X4 [Chionomys nivalis]